MQVPCRCTACALHGARPWQEGTRAQTCCLRAGAAAADVLQAPAAPRHEIMVRDDARDWTVEQMAHAQWRAAGPGPEAAAAARRLPRPIAAVEEGARPLSLLLLPAHVLHFTQM